MGLILLSDYCRFYSKQGVLPNCFSFAKVSVNQMTKMLEELQVSKSTGLDDIPARFLRDRFCRYYSSNYYIYC